MLFKVLTLLFAPALMVAWPQKAISMQGYVDYQVINSITLVSPHARYVAVKSSRELRALFGDGDPGLDVTWAKVAMDAHIDFDKYTLLVAYSGMKNGLGSRVSISSVRAVGATRVVVDVIETDASAECGVVQVYSYPGAFALIPKIAVDAEFDVYRYSRSCHEHPSRFSNGRPIGE